MEHLTEEAIDAAAYGITDTIKGVTEVARCCMHACMHMLAACARATGAGPRHMCWGDLGASDCTCCMLSHTLTLKGVSAAMRLARGPCGPVCRRQA